MQAGMQTAVSSMSTCAPSDSAGSRLGQTVHGSSQQSRSKQDSITAGLMVIANRRLSSAGGGAGVGKGITGHAPGWPA